LSALADLLALDELRKAVLNNRKLIDGLWLQACYFYPAP
jgi:hypothetical protein